MQRATQRFFVLMAMAFVLPLGAQEKAAVVGEIKYISKQTYYVDLGSGSGLAIGDTLLVKRDGRVVGKLVIEHIARRSSACALLSANVSLNQGDRVEGLVAESTKEREAPVAEPASEPSPQPEREEPPAKPRRPSSPAGDAKTSLGRVSGRIGLQGLWFQDVSGSGLGHRQFSLRTQLRVQELLGWPLEFRVRWRSGGVYRDASLGERIPGNTWLTQIYEMALVYDDPQAPVEFSLGRVLSRRIRGLGYVDGGLVTVHLHGPWRAGVAGGTEPGLSGTGFQTDEQKFGLFVNFERGTYQDFKLSSTLAFSGRYQSGQISREFLYLQNSVWKGSRFSLYQSVELDLNRGWKGRDGGNRWQLSNFFATVRFAPTEALNLTLSYDARRRVRVYETRSVPDSLFDEATRQGLRAGASLRFNRHIRLSGTYGVRFSRGPRGKTTSAFGTLSLRRLFDWSLNVYARVAYFSTRFTQGYRPTLSLRFAPLDALTMNVSAGTYQFKTGVHGTGYHWLEAAGLYRVRRWLFLEAGLRATFPGGMASRRVFLETSVNF